MPNFIKCCRDIAKSTPHFGGWVAAKIFEINCEIQESPIIKPD